MKTKILMTIGTAFLVWGCGPSGNQPNVEIIQDMMESPAYKPQEAQEGRPNVGAMRLPPEGTVPMGSYMPYPYKNDGEGYEKSARYPNPFNGDMSPEIISLGQKKYEIYCAVCHGEKGDGKGNVLSTGAYKIAIPSLVVDRVKAHPDGRIFHFITYGFGGNMKGYGSQIPNHAERWAIVNYIRSMQKASEKQVGQVQ